MGYYFLNNKSYLVGWDPQRGGERGRKGMFQSKYRARTLIRLLLVVASAAHARGCRVFVFRMHMIAPVIHGYISLSVVPLDILKLCSSREEEVLPGHGWDNANTHKGV